MPGVLRIEAIDKNRTLDWPLVGHHQYIQGSSVRVYRATLDDLLFKPHKKEMYGRGRLECYDVPIFEGYTSQMSPIDLLARKVERKPTWRVESSIQKFAYIDHYAKGHESKLYRWDSEMEQYLEAFAGNQTIVLPSDLIQITLCPLEQQVIDFLNADQPAQPKKKSIFARFSRSKPV